MQEVNVKHADEPSEPDRCVTRGIALNTPELGRCLKHRLSAVIAAVAAGEPA